MRFDEPAVGRGPNHPIRQTGPVRHQDDFRAANILHDGDRITAVLDFEDIKRDTRVADLAKAAVLLAARYRDWGPTSESIRTAFLNAYDSHARNPLTASERDELAARMGAHLKAFGWA